MDSKVLAFALPSLLVSFHGGCVCSQMSEVLTPPALPTDVRGAPPTPPALLTDVRVAPPTPPALPTDVKSAPSAPSPLLASVFQDHWRGDGHCFCGFSCLWATVRDEYERKWKQLLLASHTGELSGCL